MPAQATGDNPVSYPCLKRTDINRLIGLLWREEQLAVPSVAESADSKLLSYLIGFHTKRWGLPDALRETTKR